MPVLRAMLLQEITLECLIHCRGSVVASGARLESRHRVIKELLPGGLTTVRILLDRRSASCLFLDFDADHLQVTHLLIVPEGNLIPVDHLLLLSDQVFVLFFFLFLEQDFQKSLTGLLIHF